MDKPGGLILSCDEKSLFMYKLVLQMDLCTDSVLNIIIQQ